MTVSVLSLSVTTKRREQAPGTPETVRLYEYGYFDRTTFLYDHKCDPSSCGTAVPAALPFRLRAFIDHPGFRALRATAVAAYSRLEWKEVQRMNIA